MGKYNKLVSKLKLCYPEIKIDIQTENNRTGFTVVTCKIFDDKLIVHSGVAMAPQYDYCNNPNLAGVTKIRALQEALAYAGIDLDTKDVRYMTKLTVFRPIKQYASKVSWKRLQGGLTKGG